MSTPSVSNVLSSFVIVPPAAQVSIMQRTSCGVETILDFEKEVISSFLSGGNWNLPELKNQITKDLTRCDIRINGERIVKFSDLCEKLNVPLSLFEEIKLETNLQDHLRVIRFMALLQQGAVVDLMKILMNYFQKNAPEYFLGQPVGDPDRLAILDLIMTYAVKGQEEAILKFRQLKNRPELEAFLHSAYEQGYLPETFIEGLLRPEGQLPVIYLTQIHGRYSIVERFPLLEIRQVFTLRNSDSEENGLLISSKLNYQDGQAVGSWEIDLI